MIGRPAAGVVEPVDGCRARQVSVVDDERDRRRETPEDGNEAREDAKLTAGAIAQRREGGHRRCRVMSEQRAEEVLLRAQDLVRLVSTDGAEVGVQCREDGIQRQGAGQLLASARQHGSAGGSHPVGPHRQETGLADPSFSLDDDESTAAVARLRPRGAQGGQGVGAPRQ